MTNTSPHTRRHQGLRRPGGLSESDLTALRHLIAQQPSDAIGDAIGDEGAEHVLISRDTLDRTWSKFSVSFGPRPAERRSPTGACQAV